GLAVGTYTGVLVATAAPATNSPFSVPVTLTITPATPAILVTAMVNAASMNPSAPQAANSILAAFGTFPGCSSGAQVQVDNNPTTVFYSSPTQVNFLLPARVAGEPSAAVQFACAGLTSAAMPIPIAASTPGI